jgi:hypothetical protein
MASTGSEKFACFLSNISNPTMRTGLDFTSAQFDQAREAKPRTGSKCKDLKFSPVRIERFEMTSHTNNHYLFKVR